MRELASLVYREKIAVFLLLLFCLMPHAHAHDPSLHGFNMTTFDPPFPAPPFELAEYREGRAVEPVSLEALNGSYVLLNFWATWCPPCIKEMPTMEAAFQKFKDRGFKVVAISSDEGGVEDIAPFIEKLGVTFTVLMDPDKKASTVYGATNLPLTFLLNPDGEVIAGSEGERDWAGEEALSVLDELIQPL